MTDRYKWDLPLTGTQSTKVRPRRFRYGMWLYDVRQLPPRLMRASTERLDRREVRQASVRYSAMSACAGFAWRLSLQLRVFAPMGACRCPSCGAWIRRSCSPSTMRIAERHAPLRCCAIARGISCSVRSYAHAGCAAPCAVQGATMERLRRGVAALGRVVVERSDDRCQRAQEGSDACARAQRRASRARTGASQELRI